MTKLTEKQISDYKWLQEIIDDDEMPYIEPDEAPYLMMGNNEYIKENLEQDVENALARGEAEYPDALDTVVKYLKEEGIEPI